MIAISLFDYTGNMVKPWAEAGFDCYCYDIQHPYCGCETVYPSGGRIEYVHADLMNAIRIDKPGIAFVSAFPVCTDLSVSGAKHFKKKGLRRLADAIHLFATAQEVCEASCAPYMIENPVSTISTYWREPDYTFDPCQYTGYPGGENDHYTKKTCLWTGGGFVMPAPKMNPDDWLTPPDDRIHKAAPGPDRANFRSATPMGFARAVFEANGVKP